MELQNSAAQPYAIIATQQVAPPPSQQDGRASADAIATTLDPRPDIPIPIPANSSQTGLVSKAALSEKESAPRLGDAGLSSAERTLKPYGINMLPEKLDAPDSDTQR